MDFLELAKNRFSLRKFSDKKVEKEKIDYILAAMQAAPTAVNFQPQRILVLTDEKELEKVSKCTKFAFNPKDVKEQFNLPENYVPVAFLPTGYPSDDAEPSAAHSSRKDLNETVFYNSFSQK